MICLKKNGFTFIEILGVITVLALISVIILIVIDKNLKNSKEVLSSVQIENIKSAASMWRTDNIELVPDTGYFILSLDDLINSGYIDDVVDPNGDSNYDRSLALGIGINDIRIGSQDNLMALNGYTKLDYIKSTGTQYIDLGYKAKTNTEVRLDIQFIKNEYTNLANQYNNIIGREVITDNNTFQINFGSASSETNTIYYWLDKTYASGQATIYCYNYIPIVTNTSTMIVKSGSATFQGVTIQVATKTADNVDNMVLLGSFNRTQNKIMAFNRYDAKVYGFQIYEGDKMIMNLVPYMKNNRAGLYDLVGNKFYLSDGSSDFLSS